MAQKTDSPPHEKIVHGEDKQTIKHKVERFAQHPEGVPKKYPVFDQRYSQLTNDIVVDSAVAHGISKMKVVLSVYETFQVKSPKI